jgi:endonuclease/exonuclease/phosphatase (EEP) superfamily protein YafD
MTYNVNYGLGGDPEAIAAIAAADADLVLLQETTPEWERALRAALADRYSHMAFRHCCGAGGLAVLSRLPLAEREYVHSEAGWFPAWRVIVQSPGGPVQVLNLHLRPQVSDSGSVVSGYFTTPSVRLAEAEQFLPLLEPGLATLIAGDLNEGPDGRAVSYLEGEGFRNALPEFDGSQQTWRWRTSFGTVHAQLDHLLYRGAIEPLDVRVLQAGRSDHLPVVGTFELAPGVGDGAPAESSGSPG